MAIADLLAVIAPPPHPVDSYNSSVWQAVELNLGLAFPDDYAEYSRHFGSGHFCTSGTLSLGIENPSAPNYLDRVARNGDFLRMMQSIKSSLDVVPFAVYPETPGLFQWGWDDNGFIYCWLTEGDPRVWPILIGQTRDDGFERIDLPVTSFLAGLLSHQFANYAWGNLNSETAVFRPVPM